LSQFLASEVEIPSISTTLLRAVAPQTSDTLLFATPNRFANNWTSAVFARAIDRRCSHADAYGERNFIAF
jgi:hypothetical protein